MQAGIWKLLDECVILQTKSFNVLQFRLELQNCIALQRSGFKVLLHAKSFYISPPLASVNSCDCKVGFWKKKRVTQNSPIFAYIGQNPRKWKPC